ncbi:MAG: hypothetical protein M8860_10680 [marine benthic group bacterium]|nr:hypothetical protein [Candidatus Carthagonibacter metallireducens]MCL7964712.1 hypothetical protein [Gemmatimonadota bacterium]MCL7966728.1 hypothetical protein [Gemmatimonadota bacterium]MCL7980328.1 hypothetical protein [Gemmatimonadota bacterium]MCL7983136.1 hypothetical protein [Gemmatimonadota bacterium]
MGHPGHGGVRAGYARRHHRVHRSAGEGRDFRRGHSGARWRGA